MLYIPFNFNIYRDIVIYIVSFIISFNIDIGYTCRNHTFFSGFVCKVSLNKFVRLAGDLLPPPLFVPYIEMLSGLANSPQAAHHCFNLLKSTANGPLSWDHFFASIKQYYMDLRQDGAHTGKTGKYFKCTSENTFLKKKYFVD